MILITGAAGFIGSVVAKSLYQAGETDIVLVDDFSRESKEPNWWPMKTLRRIDRAELFKLLLLGKVKPDFVIHLGARTDTTEFDKAVFDKFNLNYSKHLWQWCTEFQIPLIYASSAATYGMGELGYKDDESIVPQLKPLNPYGESKNDFDKWVLQQEEQPPFWAGLKFFNVYGPNEYHKGRMASVILHSFYHIQKHGYANLFKSHHDDVEDGMQSRDFVYVKDIVKVVRFLMQNKPKSGLYNLGTGQARPFLALVEACFDAMGVEKDIRFIPTPEDIRDKYQYFTQADMSKLRAVGYTEPFYTLEEGVKDYVTNYLLQKNYL